MKRSFIELEQQLERVGKAYPAITGHVPKDLDPSAHAEALAALAAANSQVGVIEEGLREARARRKDAALGARRFIRRLHRTVGGVLGENSVEYVMVGGKRESERKHPVRPPRPRRTGSGSQAA